MSASKIVARKEQQIADLSQELAAAREDWRAAGAVQRVKLGREIKRLEAEIQQLEQEIERAEQETKKLDLPSAGAQKFLSDVAKSSAPEPHHCSCDYCRAPLLFCIQQELLRSCTSVLPHIDFRDMVKLVEHVHEQFDAVEPCNGAVAFLLDDSLSVGGHWGKQRLQQVLREKAPPGKFRMVQVTMNAATGGLDTTGFVAKIADHFAVEESDSPEARLQRVIQSVLDSVQDGSVVYIEVTNWHYLKPYHEMMLWFFTHFWQPLAEGLSQRKLLYNTRLVCVLEANPVLAEAHVPPELLCQVGTFPPDGLLRLPFPPCTKLDILRWLATYPPPIQGDIANLAQNIYDDTQGRVGQVCLELQNQFP